MKNLKFNIDVKITTYGGAKIVPTQSQDADIKNAIEKIVFSSEGWALESLSGREYKARLRAKQMIRNGDNKKRRKKMPLGSKRWSAEELEKVATRLEGVSFSGESNPDRNKTMLELARELGRTQGSIYTKYWHLTHPKNENSTTINSQLS